MNHTLKNWDLDLVAVRLASLEIWLHKVSKAKQKKSRVLTRANLDLDEERLVSIAAKKYVCFSICHPWCAPDTAAHFWKMHKDGTDLKKDLDLSQTTYKQLFWQVQYMAVNVRPKQTEAICACTTLHFKFVAKEETVVSRLVLQFSWEQIHQF